MRGLVLAAALLGASPASAAGEFQLAPTSTTVLIGAPFDIIGTVEVPEGYSLSRPTETSAGAYELLSLALGPVSAKGGTRTQDFVLRAAVFALGQQALPPMDWPLKAADGTVARTLQSPTVEVTVTPPEPGLRDTGDIRDIKPPLRPPIWAWTLGALALATLAGWEAHRRIKARKAGAAGGKAAAEVDRRTPEEIALDELQTLPSLGLPPKDSYDRLSDILRLYLERRHELPALSMTTYDLQRRLIRAELDPKARSLMKTLLDRSDLAKFARFLPPESEFDKDCESAQQVVRLLAPRPAEPPPATAAQEAGRAKPTP